MFANVLVVHATVPASTLEKYVKLANSRSGGMPYGTSGIGGGGPAMSDLIGGQIPSLFASAPSAAPQVKAGKIRALAATGAKRSAFFPDVPTIAEMGYPEYEATNWYAFVGPARTPKEIIARLNQDLVRTLNTKEIRDQFALSGEEPSPSTPEELAKTIDRELATWGRVVKAAGIQAQ